MWRVLPLQRTVPAFWEAVVPIGLWGKDTLHIGTRVSVPQALMAEPLTMSKVSKLQTQKSSREKGPEGAGCSY